MGPTCTYTAVSLTLTPWEELAKVCSYWRKTWFAFLLHPTCECWWHISLGNLADDRRGDHEAFRSDAGDGCQHYQRHKHHQAAIFVQGAVSTRHPVHLSARKCLAFEEFVYSLFTWTGSQGAWTPRNRTSTVGVHSPAISPLWFCQSDTGQFELRVFSACMQNLSFSFPQVLSRFKPGWVIGGVKQELAK